MIMYEDASLFRLQQLKERIEKADPKHVVQTVGIDLYRSIRNDVRLWKVWSERITYFENLAKNKDMLNYEQVALRATKKVVTILLKIVDSVPKHDEQKYGFFFTPDVKYDYPEETEPTLREKLKVYLDSKNYFSVKDQGKFIVSSSGRVWYLRDSPTDVGSLHNCNKVLNQHRGIYKFVQEFVKTKIYDEVVRGNRNKEEELGEAFQELAEAIEPIELKLLTDARALHTGEFEQVQLTAAAYDHMVLGRVTKGFEALDKEPSKIEKIRKSGIDVCEELAYALLLKIKQIEIGSITPVKKIAITHSPQIKRQPNVLEGIEYLYDGQIKIIKSNNTKSTTFTKTEKELCRVIFENTEKQGDKLAWDELYKLMEDEDPLDENIEADHEKMQKWRKKATDARRRVNSTVTKEAGKKIEVIGLIKGETTFVRRI